MQVGKNKYICGHLFQINLFPQLSPIVTAKFARNATGVPSNFETDGMISRWEREWVCVRVQERERVGGREENVFVFVCVCVCMCLLLVDISHTMCVCVCISACHCDVCVYVCVFVVFFFVQSRYDIR